MTVIMDARTAGGRKAVKSWVVGIPVWSWHIALNDAAYGVKSAQLLQSKLRDGLVICAVTFVELSPV